MSGLNKGLTKVKVTLKWNPSPLGEPDHDLDIVAATYTTAAPSRKAAYLVHFGSRSPDGTITLNRDSRTGQGYGSDEEMTLELDRLGAAYTRVVVGVAIQQRDGELTFADIERPEIHINEGYTELGRYDFADVASSTAVTVAQFLRDGSGNWTFGAHIREFDTDPQSFGRLMGGA